MNRIAITTGLVALSALVGPVAFAASSDSFEGNVKDAWLTGRIESMYLLNEHLSPFAISTDVENGVVTLTGTVESRVDRDLAAVLAEGIDGVVEVENELTVGAPNTDADALEQSAERTGRRDFGSWVDDATTTAAVKSRLIRNASTKGLQIDVDTNEDIVTLSGRVSTEEERQLAAELARNSSDVADVRNNLVVDPE